MFTNLFEIFAKILVASLMKMLVSSICKERKSGKKFIFSAIFPCQKSTDSVYVFLAFYSDQLMYLCCFF